MLANGDVSPVDTPVETVATASLYGLQLTAGPGGDHNDPSLLVIFYARQDVVPKCEVFREARRGRALAAADN